MSMPNAPVISHRSERIGPDEVHISARRARQIGAGQVARCEELILAYHCFDEPR